MVEDALSSVLATSPAVAALVGARIWPDKLPQTAQLPAIVYQRISTPEPAVTLDSAAASPGRCRVQLSLWALTFGETRQLVAAVRAVLHGWSGAVGADVLQLVRLANWQDDYEPGPPERFRVIADFMVTSNEGVAA